MAEDHKLDRDGILKDGASFHEANAEDMQLYETAKQALTQHRSPIFLGSNNPHQRLYVAAFDGTGNDADKNPEHATNIADIRWQIEEFGNPRIKVGYVAGPGTQDGFVASVWDGARGHTYDERIEKMYELFIAQAWEWKKADPNVQISLADIGFSRGAEQAVGFARLVHERGIQDPTGAKYTRNERDEIIGVTYNKPPLVPPGQVAQVAGLFDPVGTGEPVNEKDRRPPASVIDGFQLRARDEIRVDFKGTNILDQGTNSIGRFLGVTVPGAHSDVGGSYHRNGLSNRAGNLMIDYLNSLSDKPYLAKLEEPSDPRRNVIHHSHEHLFIYGLRDKVNRMSPEGTIDRLVPKNQMDKVPDPYNAELRDNALNARFERQSVRIGPVPTESRSPQPQPEQDSTLRGSGQTPHQTTLLEPAAAPDLRTLPACDWRRPDHPNHGRYEALRERIGSTYAQAGIVIGDEQLDRSTAAVARDMEKCGLSRADRLFLLQDANGAISPDSGLAVQQGQYPLMLRSMISNEALQQPSEQSFEQLQQIATQRTQEQEPHRQTAAQQAPVLA